MVSGSRIGPRETLALIARLAAIIPPETPAQCKASYDNVVVPREDHVGSPPQIR